MLRRRVLFKNPPSKVGYLYVPVCEVQIDPETGVVAVVRYTAVDDVGTIVHETVVDGQTHGGIAQGLGQVLGEHVRYGDDGQVLNASVMDYSLPRAADMPVMATAHHSVPCTDLTWVSWTNF